MTPEYLASLAAIVLSLLFSYVPGFATWYNAFEGDKKRLFMLLLLFLVSAAAFGLGCLGWFSVPGVVCTEQGLMEFIKVFVAAVIANQSINAISPRRGLKAPAPALVAKPKK